MSAAKLFNALPANIRNSSDFKVYCKEVISGRFWQFYFLQKTRITKMKNA